MTSLDNQIHELVALIYEAAAEPDHWPRLLQGLAEFVDHAEGLNSLPEASRDLIHAPSRGTDVSPADDDAWLPPIKKIENAVRGKENTSPVAGVDYNSILLSHFGNALKVARRLFEGEEEKDAISYLLDRLPIAVLVVDAECNILESNAQARHILVGSDVMLIKDGKVSCQQASVQNELYALVRKTSRKADIANEAAALSISADNSGKDYITVFLIPLRGSRLSDGVNNVAMFLTWPKWQSLPLPTTLGDMYGLTPAELQIASLLIRGYSVKQMAAESDVSEYTVRTQMKSVLAKTKTTRQVDLIKLLMTGPGSLLEHVNAGAGNYRLPGVSDSASSAGEARDRRISLEDGRALSFCEYGDAHGPPLFYFHSVLGSRLEGREFHRLAKALGVRLIAPERPGFGLSDPRPERSMLDWAQDIEQLANVLGIERFAVAGYAMGGQFACALAQALPQRVERVFLISVGSPPQSKAEFQEMIPLYRMNARLARHLPQVHRMLISIMRKSILDDPAKFFAQLSGDLPAAERALFDDAGFVSRLHENLHEVGRQGAHHMAWEMELWMQGKDFDAAEVSVPVEMWHGENDRHVPSLLGRRLAGMLPNVMFHSEKGSGHLMIYRAMRDVFDSFLRAHRSQD